MEKKNGYILTRQWLDFARDNPAIVNATHYALVMVIIDLNNRLKWKTQFGLPTDVTMEEANIKTRKVYYKTLKNLVEWGFIKLVQKAKNNHTSNVIECVIFTQSRPSQPDLSESIRHTHDTLKTHIDKQRKTEKNFLKAKK